jgi:heme-degrading monooxygenase HmoA
MITRIWHGKTKAGDAENYLQFLMETGIKEYMATSGNLEVRIWRKQEKEIAHFWTISTWTDMESIKAFAGEEVEKAKYYPDDSIICENPRNLREILSDLTTSPGRQFFGLPTPNSSEIFLILPGGFDS